MNEVKKLSVVDSLNQSIEKMRPQFQLALPKSVDPDRFIRIAQTMIKTNPTLQRCTPMSIYAGLLKSAQTGLYCDNLHAALVPFGDQATFMPMIKGVILKCMQSGEISSIDPDIVYENDEFDYYKDQNGTHFLHRPNYNVEDRGPIKLAYSKTTFKDGMVIITVMSKSEIDKIRNSSRSKNSPTWTNWYEEMAKKTVIRRQAKYLPSSDEVESMFAKEDDSEIREVSYPQLPESTEKKQTRLKKLIKEMPKDIIPPVIPENNTEEISNENEPEVEI